MTEFPKSVLNRFAGVIVHAACEGGAAFVGGPTEHHFMSWNVRCRAPGSPTEGSKDLRYSVVSKSFRDVGKRTRTKWEVKQL